MHARIFSMIALVFLFSAAELSAQEVGKPLPKWNPPNGEAPKSLATLSEFEELKRDFYTAGQPTVYVFVKCMDEASGKLLEACNAALAAKRTKYFEIFGYFPVGTNESEAKAFLDVMDVRFDFRIQAAGEFDEWKAIAKQPVAVVIEGDDAATVRFAGTDGFDKAIDEAVAASKVTWRMFDANSPKAVVEAMADTVSCLAALKKEAAAKAAQAALKKFAGSKKDKEQIADYVRRFEDESVIKEGSLILQMQRAAFNSNWIAVRSYLSVCEYTFDCDKAKLDEMFKEIVDYAKGDPALNSETELKLQDALVKLLQDTAAKTRKERSKALRDFAKKNKGTHAAEMATAKADNLDLVEKKMAAKPK